MMSYATGTASDVPDLLTKLNTFIVGLGWAQLRGVAGDEYIWQGPGNDGLAQIIVGAKHFYDVPGDYDNVRLGGFSAFDAGVSFTAQAGACVGPCLPLWAHDMTYWFVGNARRVIMVVNVSTSYESAYLGLINPYAPPGVYPYPLAVGGSLAFVAEPGVGSASWRWSNNSDEHRAFPMPGLPGTFNDNGCQLRLRRADGYWRGFAMRASGAINPALLGSVFPYSQTMSDWRPNLGDDSYTLLPVILNEDTPNVLGELDGVFAVTGHGNSVENTITIGGDTYLVVQDTSRTSKASYFAVKLA